MLFFINYHLFSFQHLAFFVHSHFLVLLYHQETQSKNALFSQLYYFSTLPAYLV
ncbi:hypothetical protein SAMD00023520_00338 [Listeria monocytogenes]|nr:hypothetical protein SAMD00023519_00960 [Listeria monocytogenes]GAT40404.1 hypothetical protein SAMD00023520_00338 [Listeria monocytogenes]